MSALRLIAAFVGFGAVAVGGMAMAGIGLVAQKLGLVPQSRRGAWGPLGDERRWPTRPAYASRTLRIEAKRFRTGHMARRARWEARGA